jgi:hypothetical protein
MKTKATTAMIRRTNNAARSAGAVTRKAALHQGCTTEVANGRVARTIRRTRHDLRAAYAFGAALIAKHLALRNPRTDALLEQVALSHLRHGRLDDAATTIEQIADAKVAGYLIDLLAAAEQTHE